VKDEVSIPFEIEQLEKNLLSIKNKLSNYSCRLVAVTKYREFEDILKLLSLEQFDFGENKLQSLRERSKKIQDYTNKNDNFKEKIKSLNWHFIGRLQSNKVKSLLKIPNLRMIHSIHNLKLLKLLYKEANEFNGNILGFFLQLNPSKDPEKAGFIINDDGTFSNELIKAIDCIFLNKNETKINFQGFMCMAPSLNNSSSAIVNNTFNDCRKLKDNIEKKYGFEGLELSMGMSGDFEIALKNNSNYVRVGSLLFEGL
jgi:PLP dependent protein